MSQVCPGIERVQRRVMELGKDLEHQSDQEFSLEKRIRLGSVQKQCGCGTWRHGLVVDFAM